MANNNGNGPSDLQITLITAGLVFLGIIAVAGLILNAVNPNFHLLSRGQQQTEEEEQEYEEEDVPTAPVVNENVATESAQQATESGKQASPSGEQASPSAELRTVGPTCTSCGD